MMRRNVLEVRIAASHVVTQDDASMVRDHELFSECIFSELFEINNRGDRFQMSHRTVDAGSKTVMFT